MIKNLDPARRQPLPYLWLAAAAASVLSAAASSAPAAEPAACSTRTLQVGTLARSYILCVPPSLEGPAPLVLAFHGGGMTAQSFMRRLAWEEAAGELDFIVAYPNGCLGLNCNGGSWNMGRAPAPRTPEGNGIDDQAFVAAMIADISVDHPVDGARVSAFGASAGGMLAYSLACDMSDTFAAVGAYAASLADETCAPNASVPVFHIHGDQDEKVGFYEGTGSAKWPVAEDALLAWSDFNGCDVQQAAITYDDGVMTCAQYGACVSGSPVEWCLIAGGGHSEWTQVPAVNPFNWVLTQLLGQAKSAPAE